MSDERDIVERLKAYFGLGKPVELMQEAAAEITRLRTELEAERVAAGLLAAFIAVPAKYAKDRGPFCGSECLGTCEDCRNEQGRIDAMNEINSNPLAAAHIAAAKKGDER